MSFVFFFKQKTAYEMRISDWSSDMCSSDLDGGWISLQPSSNENGGHGERYQRDQRQWPKARQNIAGRHRFQKAAFDDDQEMGQWNRLSQTLQQHGHVLDRRGDTRHQNGWHAACAGDKDGLLPGCTERGKHKAGER